MFGVSRNLISGVLGGKKKSKEQQEKQQHDPIITENKRHRIWECQSGHRVKRRGKYKDSDVGYVHFWDKVCGRLTVDEVIEVGRT